jgi:hypothetical protein
MKMVEKFAKALAITAAILMVTAGSALAEKIYGDVIVGAGEIYTVKTPDGKEYQIDKVMATGVNLQNGDAAVMEMEGVKPVGVKKLSSANMVSAEVVKTEGGVYTVKGKDGKEIQIKQELVQHFNPKTGETVDVYMEGASAVHVKKHK